MGGRNMVGMVLVLAVPLVVGTGCERRTGPESSPEAVAPELVIADVTLVDPASGESTSGRTVEIAGGRIVRVGPAVGAGPGDAEPGAANGDSVRVVDGRERFLLPGLADMHVHVTSDTLALGVYLAHGITQARIMSGSLEALALRDGVESGAIAGPELTVAGPLLAGEPVPWPHTLVRTAEEGRRAALATVEDGYDYLKVYDGLSADAFEAIRAVSDSTGVSLVGHLPAEVGIRGAIEAGMRSIEHAEQLLYAHHGRDAVMSLSAEHAVEPAAALVGSEVFVVPTLAAVERLMRRGTSWTAGQFEQPAMAWVNPELLGWWESVRGAAPDPARLERRLSFVASLEALTRALHEHGITIMAGTDTPHPLLVPGLGLHAEIAQYAELGLAPHEALATATVAPARFLGREGELGIIAEGAAAELVLLERNPLEDLSALDEIAGVVRGGEYLDREALDGLLQAAAEGYGAGAPPPDTTVISAGR